jgi:hypothetical protein
MSLLSEEEIEIQVEKMYDKVDKKYNSNLITPEEYLVKTHKIDRWAEEQYRLLRNAAFWKELKER